MAAVANSKAELGTGLYNLQEKIIQYGPSGKKERYGMRWRSDMPTPCWVSDTQNSIENRDAWIMNAETNPTSGGITLWGYVTVPTGAAGQFGQSSYSWSPEAIRHAKDAFTAGLILQERLIMNAWVWQPTDSIDLATVWYPVDQGDSISNVLIPDEHLGIQFACAPGQRRFRTTGWLESAKQDTLVGAVAKNNLMPHLYGRDNTITASPNVIEFIVCQWRWTTE